MVLYCGTTFLPPMLPKTIMDFAAGSIGNAKSHYHDDFARCGLLAIAAYYVQSTVSPDLSGLPFGRGGRDTLLGVIIRLKLDGRIQACSLTRLE
jgi:hypothetical protein